jgi:hypothetical protein
MRSYSSSRVCIKSTTLLVAVAADRGVHRFGGLVHGAERRQRVQHMDGHADRGQLVAENSGVLPNSVMLASTGTFTASTKRW